MQHVQESAEIVAKLVGFCESGEHVSKEMFELNFAHPSDKKTWMGWNLISNLLNLINIANLERLLESLAVLE
ncbi:kinesin-like protein NACK2 isoform X4 [Prunus yedoensis var. nudiflora]|uniref:Kinesin-like protein NACK2 isoform X4 n=1 Tax=Prunus yedoensis var. nudiflora TaxID=2094558 RepID=A0A314Z1Q8_PRUYE|nr:kinesin-like protein NACK2 isoform X4 [Prunus yedoensis var. nudiflora]